MKIGFIGAGKVGFALGKYLSQHGQVLSGYLSKNPNVAIEAAEFTNSKSYTDMAVFLMETDIVFITTSDDQIKNVWRIIKNYDISDKLIIHTSGSLSSDIFTDIHHTGAYGYSLHPFMAITTKEDGPKRLAVSTFTLEGHEKHIEKVKSIVPARNKLNIIDGKNKALYHASAVFASNFTVALAHISDSMLKHIGIDDTDTVLNIMENTIVNLKSSGIIKSLTGPVERGDSETIEMHIANLSGQNLKIYKEVSKDLLEIAKKKNKDRDYSNVKKILEQ